MGRGVIEAGDSLLCVVDIQERLLPHIHNADQVLRGAGILIQAAGLLGLPVLLTEQYPKGLGPTVEALRDQLSTAGASSFEKTSFSCLRHADFAEAVEKKGRFSLVLCGIESHVCVLQTALDGLEKGLRAVVVADAVGSRAQVNHEEALNRLRQAGATIATVEMVVMEWLRDAKNPNFKAVQGLIK
jgi:nicotinamidase-related amidase